MGFNPDRTRMSQLVSAEMKYFGSQYALHIVVGSTTLISMLAVLFSVFYYIGQTPTAQEYAYLVASIAAFSVFLLGYIVYRVVNKIKGAQYNVVMGFSAFCYFICAISGFIFARIVWLWQVYEISQGAYNRYIDTIFSWCFLGPILLIVFYFAIVYVFVDFPLPYISWSYNFYAFVPISILVLVSFSARISNAENSIMLATFCALSYLSVTLMLVIHFLFKLVLNSVLVSTPARYETFVKARRSVPKPNEKKITALDLRAAAEKVKHGGNPNDVAAETLDIHTPSATMPELPAIESRRPIFEKLAPAINLYKGVENAEATDTNKKQTPIVEALSKLGATISAFALSLKERAVAFAKDKSDEFITAKALKESTSATKVTPTTISDLASATTTQPIEKAKDTPLIATDIKDEHTAETPIITSEEVAPAVEQPSVAAVIQEEQSPVRGLELVDEILGAIVEPAETPKESTSLPIAAAIEQSINDATEQPALDKNSSLDSIKAWFSKAKQSIASYINEFKMPTDADMHDNNPENGDAFPQTQSVSENDTKTGKEYKHTPIVALAENMVSSIDTIETVVEPVAQQDPSAAEPSNEVDELLLAAASSNIQDTTEALQPNTANVAIAENPAESPKAKKRLYEAPHKATADSKGRKPTVPKIKADKFVMPEAYKYEALDGFVMHVKPAPVRNTKTPTVPELTANTISDVTRKSALSIDASVTEQEIIVTASAGVETKSVTDEAGDFALGSKMSEAISSAPSDNPQNTTTPASAKKSKPKQKTNIYKASENDKKTTILAHTEQNDLDVNEVMGTGIETKHKDIVVAESEGSTKTRFSAATSSSSSSSTNSFFGSIKFKLMPLFAKNDKPKPVEQDHAVLSEVSDLTETSAKQAEPTDNDNTSAIDIANAVASSEVDSKSPEVKKEIVAEPKIAQKNYFKGTNSVAKSVTPANATASVAAPAQTPAASTQAPITSQPEQDKIQAMNASQVAQKNRDWYAEIQSQLGLFSTQAKKVAPPLKNEEPDIIEQLEEPAPKLVERVADTLQGGVDELVEVMEDIVLAKPMLDDNAVQTSTTTPPLDSQRSVKPQASSATEARSVAPEPIAPPTAVKVTPMPVAAPVKTRVIVKPVRRRK